MKLDKTVHMVGVAAGIAAGIAGIIAGIALKKVAFIVWGVVFLAGGIVAVAAGARATPGGSISPPSVRATYKEIPDGAFWIIAALFVVGVVCTFIFPPWK
jgi:hypothetical protein